MPELKKMQKSLYPLLPFKKLLFTSLNNVWTPTVGINQHRYFNDTIIVAGSNESFKMLHYGHELENEFTWKELYNGWEIYSMRVRPSWRRNLLLY